MTLFNRINQGRLSMNSEQELHELQDQVKQLATKLDVVDQKLRQTQKSQTEFLTRMSHELNSPLSIILGYSQLLEISDLTNDQSDNLKEIIDAANYLNEQNQHLFKLAIAKNSALKVGEVVVKHIIDDSLLRFADVIAHKEINFVLSNDINSMSITVDGHYFEQVLNNLILNAVHYTNQAGTVNLDIARLEDSFKLSIHDEGQGIPEQLYPEVFTLFHDRNVENVEGLGMGLYLAKEYVELMGGEIGFDSVDGQGTTFWISLPANGDSVQ